jgi:streptomycin 3"-adenylyltransferase
MGVMDDGSTPPLAATDQQQLAAVLELVIDELGDALVGVWLYGSAVSGGLKPESDLDVLALARRRTTDDERRRMVDGLLAVSGRRARLGPARSIELSIVAEGDVRPWRYPPRLDLQYGDWLRDDFERGDRQPWRNPNPDLAVLLTSARHMSRPLLGPPASDAFDAVPQRDLVQAMTDELPTLLDDLDGDTRNVILTLARMWVTLATGEIRSKDAAADWALARLPDEARPALEHARAIYLGEQPEDWSGQEAGVAPLVDRLVAEIRRLAEPR